jgi:hypothetical protein
MMKFNTSPEFAGLEALKKAHARQIELFESWASAKDWAAFHSNHYDWWTFPIDQPSAYGFKWVVYEGEIARLKEDAEFIQKYRRGLELLAASWGWDLQAQSCIVDPLPAQSWHNWPIRLYKAAYSARLFGEDKAFESYREYARLLKSSGVSFAYNGRDLFQLFE